MALIVQKFGGSSVANADRVRNVAGIITDTYKQGNNVVVAQVRQRYAEEKVQAGLCLLCL